MRARFAHYKRSGLFENMEEAIVDLIKSVEEA